MRQLLKQERICLRMTILAIGMMGGGFLALNKHFILLWMAETLLSWKYD
jgi:peptidoglycan biosynthesis protein MviN/MurJ (putative lipid II flippase)